MSKSQWKILVYLITGCTKAILIRLGASKYDIKSINILEQTSIECYVEDK